MIQAQTFGSACNRKFPKKSPTMAAPRIDVEKHPNVTLFEITEDFIQAADQIVRSESNAVPDFWKNKYEVDNSKNWDTFYKHNQSNFFKDRHYLSDEFSLESVFTDKTRAFHVVDMGCGVGNALLPLLNEFPSMTAKGFDCSSTAVSLLSERLEVEGFAKRCQVRSGDMTSHGENYEEYFNTADIVLLLFVQSAISPDHYDHIQKLATKILKPGGRLLFRDYGKYDMAQLRFEKASKRQPNRISEDFYVRGDGTRAKFFTEAELRCIWEKDDLFEPGEIVQHTKLFVNRKTNVEMRRIWIQGSWTKK